MGNKIKVEDLVIGESDIQMALDFLKEHPENYPNKMPESFARKQFLNFLIEDLIENKDDVCVNATLKIGGDLWCHVGFVGQEFINHPHVPGKYQLYLSIRPAKTICVLNFVIAVGLVLALIFDLNRYFIWSGWIGLTVGTIAACILLPSMKSHSEYINEVIDREIEAQTKNSKH